MYSPFDSNHSRREKTASEVRELEYELQRHKDAEAQRIEEDRRRRQEQEQEWREEREQRMRTASSWPEALNKQCSLMAGEARQEAADPEWVAGNGAFFTDSIAACRRALELWPEAVAARQAEVDELKQRLATIQDEIRLAVAAQLDAEDEGKPGRGWAHVAEAIRSEDPSAWLDW